MSILEEKGHVRRRKRGRSHIYWPRVSKKQAAKGALQGVLDVFFGGDVEQALAAHFADSKSQVSEEQAERMFRLIESARKRRE